ncbi:MAG: hypothetical protein IKG87_07855 [Clostridia bacterium]|nr:hypothetical protein [Clostridia bacterium]MBR3429994.1 hypothetical protein [Clostridia bacterium]
MEPQTLGLNCEPLSDFRVKLDEAIRMLMGSLTERDLENGTVTAKIKITRKTAVDGAGFVSTQISMEPTVGIKIGASGQVRCNMANGLMLVYGEDGEPIIGKSQLTIDEYMRSRENRTA